MNYISGLFNGYNMDSDIANSSPNPDMVNPPVTFSMERNPPSSFDMDEMEYGNAPPRSGNKNYEKPTRAERQRDGVRFGANRRKFFDKTQPASSINRPRENVRRAEEVRKHPALHLNRSRSLSDSLSELSDMSSPESIPDVNVPKNSSSFRSISSLPGEDMLRRSPSPVTSPQTMKEYSDQITKDAHEKELALALMRRPSSPDTNWHGGKRPTKSGCSTNRMTRRTKRRTKSGCSTNRTKRRTKRSAKRSAKRRAKRPTKSGCSTNSRRVKR